MRCSPAPSSAEEIDARLLATERENVAVYGYGVKGFTLSMIETAIEVTNGKVDADTIYRILCVRQGPAVAPGRAAAGRRRGHRRRWPAATACS